VVRYPGCDGFVTESDRPAQPRTVHDKWNQASALASKHHHQHRDGELSRAAADDANLCGSAPADRRAAAVRRVHPEMREMLTQLTKDRHAARFRLSVTAAVPRCSSRAAAIKASSRNQPHSTCLVSSTPGNPDFPEVTPARQRTVTTRTGTSGTIWRLMSCPAARRCPGHRGQHQGRHAHRHTSHRPASRGRRGATRPGGCSRGARSRRPQTGGASSASPVPECH
jgi:hypothetical protein